MSKLATLAAAALVSLLSVATQGCAAEPGDEAIDGEEAEEQDAAIRRGTSGIAGRKLEVEELVSLLRDAGIAEATIPKMVCTAYYESKWHDRSWNARNNNGSIDRGLFQINSVHLKGAYTDRSGKRIPAGLCFGTKADDLWDLATNTACAKKVLDAQGLDAWYGYDSHRTTKVVPNIERDGSRSRTWGTRQQGCDSYKIGDVIERQVRL